MTKWAFSLKWLIFSVSYFSLAFLCLETRDNDSLTSIIWLPAGLTLGVLCSTSPSRWPIWLITAGVFHLFASYLHHRPAGIALVFALNDLMTLCLSALFWQSAGKASRYTNNLSAMAIFIGIVLVASIIGGVVSVFSLSLLSYPIVLSHFIIWSVSNASGCLAMAPLFVVRQLSQITVNKRADDRSLLLMAAILILTAVLFLTANGFWQSKPTVAFVLSSLLGLTLLSSLFINKRRLSFLFVALALIVSIATIYNRGPFASDNYRDASDITASQLYLLAIFISGLLVRSGITDIYVAKNYSDRQLTLMKSVMPGQTSYQFKINIAQQILIWSTPEAHQLHVSLNLPATPAQLLGRMSPGDRETFTPWFEGVRNTSQVPFSKKLQLVLNGSSFSNVYIALLNDRDNSAGECLNGILIVYESNLSQVGG